ncbi:hypothetical protein FRC11_002774, partial [Ceratobasidium sp. 423]
APSNPCYTELATSHFSPMAQRIRRLFPPVRLKQISYGYIIERFVETCPLDAASKSNNDASQEDWNRPPPIPFKMSDESEDEDEHHVRGNNLIAHATSPARNAGFQPKSLQCVLAPGSGPTRKPASHGHGHQFQGSNARSSALPERPTLGIPPFNPKLLLVYPGLPVSSRRLLPLGAAFDASHRARIYNLRLGSCCNTILTGPPALRSASPGLGSNSYIVRSSSPIVRSSSPALQSATSLPTPVTPTPSRSPAPSGLSFTSGRYVDRQSSSPYPPPTGNLLLPPNGTHHMNNRTASVYMLSIAPKELVHPAPTGRKYAGSTIGLPSPATSASGTGAALASTSSDTTTPSTTTPPTVQAPFSQTPATQWMVPQVIVWLQSKGFDAEIQRAFQGNEITGDIELNGPMLKENWAERVERLVEACKCHWRPRGLPTGARPTSLVLSPTDGTLATRGFWDLAWGSKEERGVLSKGEPSHKPDITNTKQSFDQPQPMPTTTIKTDTKTDPSEAGSIPISSFPLSPSFKHGEGKGKDVKTVTGSEDATSPGHAKR